MTVKECIMNVISRSQDGSQFFNNSFPNYDGWVRGRFYDPFVVCIKS